MGEKRFNRLKSNLIGMVTYSKGILNRVVVLQLNPTSLNRLMN
jgi:hypothetical protein